MFENGLCTLRDIDNCIRAGGKLIGVTGKNKSILSSSDIKYISLPKKPKNKNSIVVNGRKTFNVDYLIYPDAVVQEVSEIIKFHDNERYITFYIDVTSWEEDTEYVTTELMLTAMMMCLVSGNEYIIKVVRYRSIKEIENSSMEYKVIVSSDSKHLELAKKLQNIIPIPTIDRLDIERYLEFLKYYLNLSKDVDIGCAYDVMVRYRKGLLTLSPDYELWVEAYYKFINIENNKSVYLPELLVSDPNTRTIVKHLVHEYKNNKNALNPKKDQFIPIDYTPDNRMVGGTAKEKTDHYLKTIVADYIASNVRTYKAGGRIIKTLVDFNGLLHKDVSKSVANGMGVYVIAILKGKNRNDVRVRVYGPGDLSMTFINECGYIKSLVKSLKVLTYSLEYINV